MISSKEVKEATTNFLEDAANAVLGDPVALGEVFIGIVKSPSFFREQFFWIKFEAFWEGVFIGEEDSSKLREKFSEKGNKEDSAFRLLSCIDKIETKKKIRFLINATNSLLADYIDLETFFRICHIITNSIEEDSIFLSGHIDESDLPYDTCVQSLFAVGLMYQSVIDANGNQKYSFTPFARKVNRFALCVNNGKKLQSDSMMTEDSEKEFNPRTKISVNINPITNDGIDMIMGNNTKM